MKSVTATPRHHFLTVLLVCSMTIHLKNLEISENFADIRDFNKNQENVTRKKILLGKIA